jgi:hypothetical protein
MKASPLRPISIGISPADLQLQSITAFRRYDMLYGNDDKTFRFTRRNPDGTVPVACAVVTLPGGVQIVNPTSSPNCLVGGINNTPPQVFAQDRVDFRRALSYLPTDDITLYASVVSGYKAGGANSRPSKQYLKRQSFPPEGWISKNKPKASPILKGFVRGLAFPIAKDLARFE